MLQECSSALTLERDHYLEKLIKTAGMLREIRTEVHIWSSKIVKDFELSLCEVREG